MSANKPKNSKPELLLRKALWAKNLRGYRLHKKSLSGRPDIAFPAHKIAIFVNGCYWHRCPYCQPNMPKTNLEFWNNKFERNKIRDRKKNMELEKQGWKVMTFWECEIKRDLALCVDKIEKALKKAPNE